MTKGTFWYANSPKKLVTTEELEGMISVRSWFELDGMSTGKVSMLYTGPGARFHDMPEELAESTMYEYAKEYTFDIFGAKLKGAKAGTRGCPIVHEPEPEIACRNI